MIARLLKVLVCLLLFAMLAAAQQTQLKPSPSPSPEQPEDIIKVYTELRQTDVMVFDSKGQFVDGLTREHFELKIDGKPAPITFFERVEAGTGKEEKQWLAARDQRTAKPTAPTSYGRKVLFFVDDIHMSPTSIVLARNLITKYLDYEQTEYDEAQIASSSGNVGFFQQLTDNKTVLRYALEKLTPYHRTGKDFEIPPMGSYNAFLIERGDTEVLDYFVDELIKQNRFLTRPVATDLVRARAANIMRQASHWVLKTLGALDNVIRDSTNVPGRKVLFFISDGFLINSNYNDMSNAIRSLGSDAARAGVVIYSIDARGLVPPAVDNNASGDLSNRMARSNQGEVFAYQDPLNSLAEDSGGRPLFNNNDLYVAVDRGLKETSFYYLLGWTPEQTNDGPTKFRKLEVSVVGRPDLKVRVRKGAFTVDPTTAKPAKRSGSEKTQTVVAKLQHALAASGPSREIPVSVALSYVDTPEKGSSLSVVMEIPIEALSSDVDTEKPSTSVDFAGAVFDREGKSTTTFGQNVKVAEALKSGGRKLTYTHTVFPRPGLYQVRVAARDALSGRVGTAKSWIQIPDLSAKKLTLSSLVVGERPASNAELEIVGRVFSDRVPLNVARRFKSDSFLRCLLFVYNATRTQNDRVPDVAIQVQVLRNNKPVITTPLKPIAAPAGHDHDRLPYLAEVSLKGLTPGRYTLSITAIDRAAKTSASEQMRFDVQ
jgi:VWFA-related protein